MRPFEYVSPQQQEPGDQPARCNLGKYRDSRRRNRSARADEGRRRRTQAAWSIIKDIADLRGISSSAQGLRIGALTNLGELADDENVKKNYPALSEALLEAASPQIRNMATIGGNLCQRPRCWYFRNGLGLLPKDESGKELVAAGENRYHAILGNQGPAKFVSPSTVVPILIAYGAKIRPGRTEGKT